MHKTTTVITSYGAGAEPGVNPRHFSADLRYRGRVRETCDIRVVDYSRFSIKSKRMSNQLFVDMMNDPQASERPSWSKVRWIDVGGISWDVLKVLALKYSAFHLGAPFSPMYNCCRHTSSCTGEHTAHPRQSYCQ